MRHVTSRQNPLVGRVRDVRDGVTPGLVLLDGSHLVSEAVTAGMALRDLAVSTEAMAHDEIREILDAAGVAPVTVSPAVMSALSPTRSPSGIVATAERPASTAAQLFHGGDSLVLVVCDIQDPGNVGAIVRVAEAAGATGVIVAGQSADPFSWKALRGSMGSALRLPVVRGLTLSDAIALVRRAGCRVLATTPRDGTPLFQANGRGPVAILIGSEGSGLPDGALGAADEAITIPMAAPVESLNAAVAAALLAYEVRRQRGTTRPFRQDTTRASAGGR